MAINVECSPILNGRVWDLGPRQDEGEEASDCREAVNDRVIVKEPLVAHEVADAVHDVRDAAGKDMDQCEFKGD